MSPITDSISIKSGSIRRIIRPTRYSSTRLIIYAHTSNTAAHHAIEIARQIIIELPAADLFDRRSGENKEGGRGPPNVFVFPRFLRGSSNRPRFKFNPPGLNRSILIYEYPPIRSGGRKRDSRVIYDRIRSVICKKSIIYGRHRRRSGRLLGAGDEARRGEGRRTECARFATPRARPYTRRDLGGDPEPVWNTGGHLPPARPCLGRAFAAWENTSKLPGTPRPLSTNNSFLDFVNSSSYFPCCFYFAPKRLSPLSLSLSVSCPQFMENKMSSRQLGRQLCPLCPLLIYNEFQFLRKFIENSKNNLARIIKLSLSLGSISPILTKRAKSARRIRIACSTFQPS